MASGGKRGASERVLEGKHVIGLFLLMWLFSGLFFSLGYVMGRNQYTGWVRAEGVENARPEAYGVAKPAPATKKGAGDGPAHSAEGDPSANSPNTDLLFYGSDKAVNAEPRLEPAPKTSLAPEAAKPVAAKARGESPAAAEPLKNSKSAISVPLIPKDALILQVAALIRQDDALAVASSLQKKHFTAYVQMPQNDRYYRVQVGPFKDQKSAEAAKKGLEGEGFKAFYVKH